MTTPRSSTGAVPPPGRVDNFSRSGKAHQKFYSPDGPSGRAAGPAASERWRHLPTTSARAAGFSLRSIKSSSARPQVLYLACGPSGRAPNHRSVLLLEQSPAEATPDDTGRHGEPKKPLRRTLDGSRTETGYPRGVIYLVVGVVGFFTIVVGLVLLAVGVDRGGQIVSAVGGIAGTVALIGYGLERLTRAPQEPEPESEPGPEPVLDEYAAHNEYNEGTWWLMLDRTREDVAYFRCTVTDPLGGQGRKEFAQQGTRIVVRFPDDFLGAGLVEQQLPWGLYYVRWEVFLLRPDKSGHDLAGELRGRAGPPRPAPDVLIGFDRLAATVAEIRQEQ